MLVATTHVTFAGHENDLGHDNDHGLGQVTVQQVRGPINLAAHLIAEHGCRHDIDVPGFCLIGPPDWTWRAPGRDRLGGVLDGDGLTGQPGHVGELPPGADTVRLGDAPSQPGNNACPASSWPANRSRAKPAVRVPTDRIEDFSRPRRRFRRLEGSMQVKKVGAPAVTSGVVDGGARRLGPVRGR